MLICFPWRNKCLWIVFERWLVRNYFYISFIVYVLRLRIYLLFIYVIICILLFIYTLMYRVYYKLYYWLLCMNVCVLMMRLCTICACITFFNHTRYFNYILYFINFINTISDSPQSVKWDGKMCCINNITNGKFITFKIFKK